MKQQGLTLAVDLGSTFTKVAAIDLDHEELVGVAQSPSTVDTDVTAGLNQAIENLETTIGRESMEIERLLACSSAAGGLRIVVIGLVSGLTTKAANEAALGAGGKVVATYSYGLTSEDVRGIEEMAPDLILLAGGTNGGNEQVILQSASALAASPLDAPVIIAGNKMAAPRVQSLLKDAGKYAIETENVLPEIDRLTVESARAAIRDIFMKRITYAKGLDKAEALMGRVIMPTPMAVLRGASLLANGIGDEQGFGELMAVDVGGATTDVYSIAHGYPSRQEVMAKGLPEPYEKRTVEGDLGIRYNAQSLLDMAGSEAIMEKIRSAKKVVPQDMKIKLERGVKKLSEHVDTLPESEEDFMMDIGLASMAVDVASRRHAGKIEDRYFPTGKIPVQYGKDLTKVKSVLATGGIFAYGQEVPSILRSLCFDGTYPESLRPVDPQCYVDEQYILYAVGLLAEVSPPKALRIMKTHLKRL
jgi:uncharacterized protein (TIGR01319 family)